MKNTFSPPYTPELNGIAERVNRTLMEATRSLLIQPNLPNCLCPFALKHSAYIRNGLPHSSTGSPPYVSLMNEKPNLLYIRVFGCTAYVLRLPRGSKLEARATKGVYLETTDHDIYRVLVQNDGMYIVDESRHVTLDETRFLGAADLKVIKEDEVLEDDTISEPEDSYSNIDSGTEDEISAHNFIDDEWTSNENENEVSPEVNDDDDKTGDTNDEEKDNNNHKYDKVETQEEPRAEESSSTRYPRCNRRPRQEWYIASPAKSLGDYVKVTTSDEPTLKEAMSATPDEITK